MQNLNFRLAADWNRSVHQITEDLQSLKDIVMDPKTEFTVPLIHNEKHTVFREILIMGNHNSYHTGQLLFFKRALNMY